MERFTCRTVSSGSRSTFDVNWQSALVDWDPHTRHHLAVVFLLARKIAPCGHNWTNRFPAIGAAVSKPNVPWIDGEKVRRSGPLELRRIAGHLLRHGSERAVHLPPTRVSRTARIFALRGSRNAGAWQHHHGPLGYPYERGIGRARRRLLQNRPPPQTRGHHFAAA